MDYNPSLCKDYNETGFCGYGGIAYWMILYEYGNDDDVVMMQIVVFIYMIEVIIKVVGKLIKNGMKNKKKKKRNYKNEEVFKVLEC